MKNFLLHYWWVAVALDWSSTIEAHNYMIEENPLMKYFWKNYGDIGFTIVSIIFGIIVHIVLIVGLKYGHKWSIIVSFIIMVSFKYLIALTNLAVIPYWVTAWFQF